ncbi:MAG: metal-dependent hydrolase [Armatimonadota bacterium]
MLSIRYLGHSCFTATDGEKTVIIDPFLSENPLAAAKADEVRVDAVLVTHGHSDHLGDAMEIAKACGAPVVGTTELASYCKWNGCRTIGLQAGGVHDFDFGWVKLVPAIHGGGLQKEGQITYLGEACGILLQMGGRTIYHAGDTALFGDMNLIGDLNDLDLAMLPIGGVYTMGIDDAVIAAQMTKAAHVVPMHYGTFERIKVDPGEFARRLAEQNINCRVLQPGEEFSLP